MSNHLKFECQIGGVIFSNTKQITKCIVKTEWQKNLRQTNIFFLSEWLCKHFETWTFSQWVIRLLKTISCENIVKQKYKCQHDKSPFEITIQKQNKWIHRCSQNKERPHYNPAFLSSRSKKLATKPWNFAGPIFYFLHYWLWSFPSNSDINTKNRCQFLALIW